MKNRMTIQRIENNVIFEKEDVVAVEQQVEISFSDGSTSRITCTPSHIEEMILAKKFLAGDFETEELQAYDECMKKAGSLQKAELQEIFEIAGNSFENPGSLFQETGCAHSCVLVHQGAAACCMEDIGRHNALDKVIGYALMHHIPMAESYIFTSGRISGDYMEKVIAAGFPMAVSRAAVTDAAVKLAREKNVTLLGFIRKNTGNLYHEGKVKLCEK